MEPFLLIGSLETLVHKILDEMKSPPMITDDSDDIFGPPRTYDDYCPPKSRPSMISPKYKQKEERRKVLKISLQKLKKIDDPENNLCRSVLINNTIRRLNKDGRDEILQKQQLNYPRCYDNDNFLNIKSEFMKNEMRAFDEPNDHVEDVVDEVALNKIDLTSLDSLGDFTENGVSNKRPLEDYDEGEVNDVFTHLYLPPTPRLLTSIDDDEDVNVVDIEPPAKKMRVEQPEELKIMESPKEDRINELLINNNNNNNNNSINSMETDSRLRFLGQSMDADTNSFSCGQVSLFSDIQNNVYHSLIASLET
ncbi:PREDICTED: uncharacterized protein LOC108559412 isoform X2 [Nicrophorus vespilloides]|uniref:Uncharacterized protein LOC108559412 isoform X2 n=1 Tax=Nicrophorus vespilloides TaxID=110193 RepID=A0ABM1MC72_NICVS|nr:PREDICTED: uncharacterized protein LOC108559412 isoform X2 [Nicrophorus vespilloides]